MKSKVDCIQRLIEINHSYEEISEWLILNKFADPIEAREPTRPRERAEFIYGILNKQAKDEKIILLYFEWTLLPKETIKITCVTPTEEKFFTYAL